MHVLVVTDAAPPQVNGVVRTYERISAEAAAMGVLITFLGPDEFQTLRAPFYPGIRLAIPPSGTVRSRLEAANPDYIHIATEGPIGWIARHVCLAQGCRFTTSYHTRFPEYLEKLVGFPAGLSYAPLRRFHNASAGTMVATASLARELKGRGFTQLMRWTRGVDIELFKPRPVRLFGASCPVFLYVGRVSREKNLEAFLDAEIRGLKVVVGDGPYLETLRTRYPAAIFTGKKTRDELPNYYSSADVFVFPSRTDTFGLVLLEAMASGLPVAAYPVTGPIDLVVQGETGFLDEDLGKAAMAALRLEGKKARAHAARFSWCRAAELFLENIVEAHRTVGT